MFAEIPAWLGAASPSAALVLVVVVVFRLVASGAWVPRATVELVQSVADARLKDRDEVIADLRTADALHQEANASNTESLATLVVGQETTLALLRALPARPSGDVST